jgi:organic radical activating enzyme
LPLNDVFGPTIQGEGPYMGRTVNFIRLGLCNLHCKNCDTKQTWDNNLYDIKVLNPERTVDEIMQKFHRLISSARTVVISGGEPLMHQDKAAFRELLKRMALYEIDVHIETNGTRMPRPIVKDLVKHFSVSPKITSGLISDLDPETKRIKMPVLEEFANLVRLGKACFKIVCQNEDDVDKAEDLRQELRLAEEDFWIMPAGETAGILEDTTRRILNRTMSYNLNFSPRLHILTGMK